MTRMPNLAATAAVLAVIAIVGGVTIGPRLGGAAIPSPEATPSAVASPTAVASRHPAQNGAIAVVVDTRLVLVDSTTGAILKVLVEGPTDPTAPIVVTDLTWAPDGQKQPGVRRRRRRSGDGRVRRDLSTDRDLRYRRERLLHRRSPDGSRIAVAQAGRLELVDPDGGNSTVVHEEQGIVQPVRSPDGGRIAFQVIGENPDAQRRRLVTIERDGV